MKFDPIALARLFLFVREAGDNTGLRVEAIQKWGGGQKGESWCCYFATMILDLVFGGNSPVPRLGSCQDVYDLAKKNQWITTTPVSGDLVLYVDDNDHAHHIGFFTLGAANNVWSILAGNTSEDGQSSNGTGVYEHALPAILKHVRFVRYSRQRVIALG